jgi:hypothetical protein
VKKHAGRHGLRRPQNKPVPLTQDEINRPAPPRDRRAAARACAVLHRRERQGRLRPAVDFSGEISEINEDAAKLKVLSDLRA